MAAQFSRLEAHEQKLKRQLLQVQAESDRDVPGTDKVHNKMCY